MDDVLHGAKSRKSESEANEGCAYGREISAGRGAE